MISQNPAEPQAPPLPADAKPGASTPLMDPHGKIEVASTGDGTVIDPSGHDNKPPGIGDSDPLFQLLG